MDSVLNIAGMKPKNLAEALAVQIVEPQISPKPQNCRGVSYKRPFATVKSEVASESSDQMTIKITDLMPSSMKKPAGSSLSNLRINRFGLFSLSKFDGNNISEISQGSETQE